jgi:hypothetical protein
MPNWEYALIMAGIYGSVMLWVLQGKQLRRWWRRRNLNIPDEEGNVRTIIGPLREITWVKVS